MQVAEIPSGPGALIWAIHHSKLYKNPRVVIPVLIWIFGLYAMFFSPPPQPITPEMQAMFDAKVKEAQHLNEVSTLKILGILRCSNC